jgi:hypothetical protein
MTHDDLAKAIRELEYGVVVVDSMIRRDGYTDKAKDFMKELHEHLGELAERLEKGVH